MEWGGRGEFTRQSRNLTAVNTGRTVNFIKS